MKIGIRYRDSSKVIASPVESNAYYQIIYVHQGSCQFTIGDQYYDLVADNILLIKKGEEYNFYQPEDVTFERTVISFEEDWLLNLLEAIEVPSLLNLFDRSKFGIVRTLIDDENKQYTDATFKQILRIVDEKDYIEQKRLKLLVTYLLTSFSKCSLAVMKNRSELPSSHKEIIERAVQYIEIHFAEKTQIQDIATELNVSESYLAHIFKKVMKIPIKKYMMTYRISQAKFKLLDKKKSIADISEECGFETPSHFSRVFKEFTGMTASNFRKGIQSSDS